MHCLAFRLLCVALMSFISLHSTPSLEHKSRLPFSQQESFQEMDKTAETREKTLISLDNLSLYHFLEHMYKVVNELYASTLTLSGGAHHDASTQAKLADQLKALNTISAVLTEEKTLLANIVNVLNQDEQSYLGLAYKFENFCNIFDEVKEIRLRDVRHFQEKVYEFDVYVDDYGYKKLARPLTHSNFELLNNIKKFLQHLKYGLPVWEKFLDVDIFDKMEDACIYRPWEFICKNPVLSLTVALLVAGGVFYFYVYPKIEELVLSNANPYLQGTQNSVLRQRGNECPIHALYNYQCSLNSNNDDEFRAMANDQAEYQKFRARCVQLVPGGDVELLHIEELTALARRLRLPFDNVTFIPNMNVFSQTDADRDVFLSVDMPECEAGVAVRRIRFNDGEPQSFIVNLGSVSQATLDRALAEHQQQVDQGGRGTMQIRGSRDHWVFYKFSPNSTAPEGVEFVAADSTNRNITNHQVTYEIHRILTGRRLNQGA